MHVDAAIGTKNIDSRDFRGEIEQKRVARGLPAAESIPVFRSISRQISNIRGEYIHIIFRRHTHRKRHERILQRDKFYGIARYFSERDWCSGEHARFQVHHRATLRWSAAFLSRVKMIRIIITLNPSSLRLTSKCVIFSVLGGALSSARKKSRQRYAFPAEVEKKRERERERLTRAFLRLGNDDGGKDVETSLRRRGPFVEEKSARRRSFPRPLSRASSLFTLCQT